jgi:N6-adenosine-specific RNA methylase IME4
MGPELSGSDRFRVVVADPPWRFKDRLPGPGRGAVKHYRCLSVAELCAFPLPPLADDCTLFLWRVAAMPQEALDVMAAWGFQQKTEIVWVKTTRAGTLHLGMGHTVRMTHESCLVGVRGHPVTVSRKVPSVFFARRRKHSAKPARFYDLVESLREGPFVELFARQRRAGWTSLGDQVPVTEEEWRFPDRCKQPLIDVSA